MAVAAAACLASVAASAAPLAFSTVKGIVHDPQHRPIPGATVTLKARQSDWMKTTVTGTEGSFEMTAVPVGEYVVSVSLQGFKTATRPVTIISDTSPVLHFQLELGAVAQTVTVSAAAEGVHVDSVTPTSLVSREDIRTTPGADRTNGLEAITAYVPGAYSTHNQLHLRGGHQVSWLIDGVPVPNTNIASNVGPQIDPKDVDYLEIQRGSYDAAYGDRTYGVFNVVPRTGFERDDDIELVVSGGSYYQTNDQISLGGHTERGAWFASANGNRSNLGLGTPVAEVVHDRQTGVGGFGSLIFNATPANQLRLVTSVRRDAYQLPNGPDEEAAGIDDQERESDAFLNLSWVRTFKSGLLLTASPFYHFNNANFEGGAAAPIVTTDRRGSHYAGAQVTIGGNVGTHNLQAGFYGFHQQDHQTFALTFNDGTADDLSTREEPSGDAVAVFAQDTFTVTPWLTLTGGVRQTHFSGGVTENATSPRVGATIRLPQVDWLVRGFYGRFYQEPPLLTASGPLLRFVTEEDLGFIPLRGERDEEYQIGVTVPVRGWTADVDRFQTRAENFFDHNSVGNSNVFFPLTIDRALIRGTEMTLRSPRGWGPGEVHLAYAYQTIRGRGGISGGLTDFEPPEEDGYFFLDHDQRHTFSAGFTARLPRRAFAALNAYYGSGFLDGEGPDHLPGHATVDLSVGQSVRDNLSLVLAVLNAANRHLLIDNSETFGGMHFNSPREIYVQARWRFHY